MSENYPLKWPFGKPRIQYPTGSRFGERSIEQAIKILRHEIKLLGGESEIISTNLKVRLDGLFYSKQAQPVDKGVAVYFTYNGREMCFACDRWDKVQDNIYAIAMTVGALRGIERWGSGDMVQQAFTGFVALPAPKDPYAILGVPPGASTEEIKAAYRHKARTATNDQLYELNAARDRLEKGAA